MRAATCPCLGAFAWLVTRPKFDAETFATVEATPPGYGRWDLLLYLLPFLAIGVLWAVAMLRRIKRRTGARHA